MKVFSCENFPEWYDPDEQIRRLSNVEKNIVEMLESVQDPILIVRFQKALNKIANEKERIYILIRKYK